MFLLNADKVDLRVKNKEILTSGSVKIFRCLFEFSTDWDGMEKTAVFRHNGKNMSVLLDENNQCSIPREATKSTGLLMAGVYGTKDNGQVMPTIWAELGRIREGACHGEQEQEPTPGIYEQILSRMGNLSSLQTRDKSSLVAAINEVLRTGGGNGEGGAGTPGISVTDARINEDGDLIITLSDGTALNAGRAKGKNGADGQDGQDGSPGAAGSDGFSPTVSVSTITGGNKISITDKNGTKSVDVMDGADGKDGQNGSDGYTPLKGIDYFDGANGHTPVKGVDYWTAEDKAEIMGESLMPDFIDSIDEMTDQSKAYVLTTDGMIYTYGEKTVVTGPSYTNLAVNIVTGRLNSSGALDSSATAAATCTDYIPTSPGDIIRVKGLTLGNYNISICNASKVNVSSSKPTFQMNDINGLKATQDGDVYIFTKGSTQGNGYFVRFSGVLVGDASDVIITRNEEITESGGTTTASGWVSTGMAYAPADYEGRIINLENVAVNHESRISKLENGVSSGLSYPSYWESAVTECIAKIKALQVGRNCVTFPFFSDNHQRLGYAGALIRKVMEECHIPYCFYGGDSISSGYIDSEATMIEQDKQFDSMMKTIPDGRFCRTVGNHDGFWKVSAEESHAYTRDQIYELFFREESVSQLKHFGGDGTYYFVDDIASKTRFVILNNNGGFGETQRNWVQNTALQFPESGWVVVFVSHAPVTNNFHSNITDAQTMQGIITAYINGSSANKADVVGWFSGHIHRDRIYQCDATGNVDADDQTTETLPWKTITITSDHTGIAYEDATKHTVAEDNQSHAIDFVTINKNTKTVNLTRLGIGNDRTYQYIRKGDGGGTPDPS